jgi:tetratricopeptide (TPR) repeat protein
VSDDCRRILTIAALAGKTFRFDLLVGFQGVDEDDLLDALEEATRASLVEDVSADREARYAFVHEQIRQTLLSLLSTARRQRLHLRMGDALEALHGSDAEQHAPEIAHHLYQAGAAADRERSGRWLLLAADRALDALAFEDALRDLDAARTVLPDNHAEGGAKILRLRARALRGLARIDEALEAFAEAVEIAPEGAERDARGGGDRTGGGRARRRAASARTPQARPVPGQGGHRRPRTPARARPHGWGSPDRARAAADALPRPVDPHAG